MGIAYIERVDWRPEGREDDLGFLVHNGATYSLVPSPVWEAIGLTTRRELTFAIADGSTLVRRVSECNLLLPQDEGHTPVILGELGDEARLGVVTQELLGLVPNPFNRTLQTMGMLLA